MFVLSPLEMMTHLSYRKSVVLVIVMGVIGGVHSGPRKIVRRQTVDTSHIDDSTLIDCLNAIVEGRPCSTNIDEINEIPVGPAPEQSGCTCVPSDQCEDNKSLISLVNVRSSCFDPLEICCVNRVTGTTVGPTKLYEPLCGQLNLRGVGPTLVGFQDRQAQFGQFPWMAAVRTTGGDYVCGASLIHPRMVLTAAHHVHKREAHQLTVRLGEWNFKLSTESIPHQDIRVQRIVIHPNFNSHQLWYDVAVLFLEEDAILGPTVDTICLPNPFETFDGDTCYSSGWGKEQFGQAGKHTEILKSLVLPAVNHQQCQNAYRSTRLGTAFNLHKTFMCAGGEKGVDTCTGDGGSPLVCPMKSDPSRYVQVGVVAWGIGCGTDGVPGVYGSINEAVDWIGQQLLTIQPFDIRVAEIPAKR